MKIKTAFVGLCLFGTALLSGCVVTGLGYGDSVGYGGGVYEPYGYDYGGWGGGYRVGPPPRGWHGGGPVGGSGGGRPGGYGGGRGRGAPSIPSGARGGGHR